MASSPPVSVIIPARNAAATLPVTLASLAAQTASPDVFEVIVADDGSTDDTAAIARAQPGVRMVSSPQSIGGAIRNLGVERAAGDILAFVDSDCRAAPDWIERGLAHMQRGDHAVLGGRIVAPLPPRPGIAVMLDVARYYDQERYVAEGHAAMGNLWVMRAAFEELQGFDSRLRAGADTDFTVRAVAAGHSLGYADDVVVEHPPLLRMRQLARRAFRDGKSATLRGESRLVKPKRRAYVSTGRAVARLQAAGHDPSSLERLQIAALQLGLRGLVLCGSVVAARQERVPSDRRHAP